MKAITIRQQWATLITLRGKRLETRSWSTKHRGPLAIHAGKKIDKEVCQLEPFKSVLAKHGYTADNLPTGVVVAIADLGECHRSLEDNGHMVLVGAVTFIEGNEYRFGDYSKDRYAWRLDDVERLPEPISAKGQLGLWNWEGAHS